MCLLAAQGTVVSSRAQDQGFAAMQGGRCRAVSLDFFFFLPFFGGGVSLNFLKRSQKTVLCDIS